MHIFLVCIYDFYLKCLAYKIGLSMLYWLRMNLCLCFPSQSVWDISNPFKIILLKGNKLNTEENAKVSNCA